MLLGIELETSLSEGRALTNCATLRLLVVAHGPLAQFNYAAPVLPILIDLKILGQSFPVQIFVGYSLWRVDCKTVGFFSQNQ